MQDFTITINEGEGNELVFNKASKKVAHCEISRANQEYYQHGAISIHRISTTDKDKFKINSTIKVEIDTTQIFSGYINRIQLNLTGTIQLSLQCVGKTYDLWRYRTPETITYTNTYTGTVASSLVANYCPNVSAPSSLIETNTSTIEEITFENEYIGDCLARLIGLDGYKFFVNDDGYLNYYAPIATPQFTITSADIQSMSPYEESDDYIYNDVLVRGKQTYKYYTGDSTIPTNFINLSGANVKLAQRIVAPTNKLSSVKMYLDGTSTLPDTIKGNVYDIDSGEPSSNAISGTRLSWYKTTMDLPEWIDWGDYNEKEGISLTENDVYFYVLNSPEATTTNYWKLGYIPLTTDVLNFTYDPDISSQNMTYGGVTYGALSYDGGNDEIDFYFEQQGYSKSGQFDDNGSRRYAYWEISGGTMNSDLFEFQCSMQVKLYDGGG